MQELAEKLRKFKVADKELFKTKPVGNQPLLEASQLKYRKANALRTRNEVEQSPNKRISIEILDTERSHDDK